MPKFGVKQDEDVDLRNETSCSLATYSDGTSVGLVYTDKWGDFTWIINRLTGTKPTEYRKRSDESSKEHTFRLKGLEKELNENYSDIFNVNLESDCYRMTIIDKKYIRPTYAVRTG